MTTGDETGKVLVFSIEKVSVDREDVKAVRDAASRINCASFFLSRYQAELVVRYAKKAGVSPNRWIVDAMNAYAKRDESK